MRCPYEICRVSPHTFLMRHPDKMSGILAVMRCPCKISCFMLHNFYTRYRDEMACLFGPLRGSFAGEKNVSVVMVVGASASALGDRRVFC